jgi:hypothetical protein
MQSYAGKKRINIIWMCRDAGLIEFIIHKFDVTGVSANSFVVIFYTGDRELLLPKNLPVNFFIFRKRPNLEEGISGIVTAIASGEGLPEDICELLFWSWLFCLHNRSSLKLRPVLFETQMTTKGLLLISLPPRGSKWHSAVLAVFTRMRKCLSMHLSLQ